MQTLLYKEYERNLKPTFKMVGEETKEIAPKINIDDVAFSVALMSFEYVPSVEDEDILQDYIIACFDEFIVNNELRIYSMSEIIEKATENLNTLSEEDKKKVAGFLVYCEQGLCFYEPLTLQEHGSN